jgi:hypothetical protein
LQMGFYTTMLRGKGSNVLTFGKEKLKDSWEHSSQLKSGTKFVLSEQEYNPY